MSNCLPGTGGVGNSCVFLLHWRCVGAVDVFCAGSVDCFMVVWAFGGVGLLGI